MGFLKSCKKFFSTCLFVFFYTAADAQQPQLINNEEGLQITWNGQVRLNGGTAMAQTNNAKQLLLTKLQNNVALLSVTTSSLLPDTAYAGVFFNAIPSLKKGVTFWRYKPWNSWTKPIAVTDALEMQPWDVQFFYWQYTDGTYGAAVPLSGNGFRTTLGSTGSQWGSKAVSYAPNKSKWVPAMAVAFGKDPYALFAHLYQTALSAMGLKENIQSKKKIPLPLQYIGWCTWNASNNGKDLNEKHVLAGVSTFKKAQFPLGWVLIDDGWFQQKEGQLQSLKPDAQKFPQGFKSLNQKLKRDYGVKYTGVWHTLNGYWNGIDPKSALGKRYASQLFQWTQKERPDIDSAPLRTYAFIKPTSSLLPRFYQTLHQYLKEQGFDFLKVDNQLVTERMAVGTYPIFDLSSAMHKALNNSADKYFGGAVINCMDMTADAYLNFGTSAVARAVEDYFPYEPGETYNLQKGNAAAHVVQAVYNSIYFSQMVYPDFDMFQSHHPNAVYHALARTINNGPIYLTDKPGQQNFSVLNSITFADGKSIRSATSLLPSEDCLFQVQEPKIFKAFSTTSGKGLLGIWNAADADTVNGYYKAGDVAGIKGNKFLLYRYFTGQYQVATKTDSFAIGLPRMGYDLVYVLPVQNNFAAFGLINKYNAPATIVQQTWKDKSVQITLYEGGSFRAYSAVTPKAVLVNGKKTAFAYNNGLLDVAVQKVVKPVLSISW